MFITSLKVVLNLTDLEFLKQMPYMLNIIDSIPHQIFLLNKNRVVVYSNFNKIDNPELLEIGPGYLFKCENSKFDLKYDFCGQSEKCSLCDVNLAIYKCMSTLSAVHKTCMIRSKEEDFLQNKYLELFCFPLHIDDRVFFFCIIADITLYKKQMLMEKVFFHDILNISGGMNGFLRLMKTTESEDELRDMLDDMLDISSHLTETILSQKQFFDAENNELSVSFTSLKSNDVILSVFNQFSKNNVSKRKHLVLCCTSQNISFNSDLNILMRVLNNMVKNALEASSIGGIVKVGSFLEDSFLIFKVHNLNYIPKEIQKLIFTHSFSTKSSNRGFGTYSMKLFGEKYLGGQVYFTSTKEEGTTFYLKLPLNLYSESNTK